MWQAVRRELARLEWDVEPPLTLDLMADWTQTVSSLLTIRRALGPISTPSRCWPPQRPAQRALLR